MVRWVGGPVAAVVMLLAVASCSGADDSRSPASKRDAFEIDYLVSSAVPDGWALAWAVERIGEDQGVPPDYTVVFAPGGFVGQSRAEAVQLSQGAPSLALNVGAPGWFVGLEEQLAPAVDAAAIEVDGDVG